MPSRDLWPFERRELKALLSLVFPQQCTSRAPLSLGLDWTSTSVPLCRMRSALGASCGPEPLRDAHERRRWRIDFPWDLFSAVRFALRQRWTVVVSGLAEKWKLRPLAHGVLLAPRSVIDKSVVFKGPAVVGTGAILRRGAIVGANTVICPRATVEEYCRVARFSVVGRRCRIGHCAEVSGILMDSSVVKHFTYFRGILGVAANLGAGTTCGTDRLDGRLASHARSGSLLNVTEGANEVYVGSGARTGVAASLMAGTMLGRGSIIGPGITFSGYLPDGEVLLPQAMVRMPRRRP
jgi:UDP-N-acetylglucosamine diphosphorylase / glucose-1-phosphate thymidylyltransferase / UDP-N-acetylgalactosamine diphosphorylase / glucosamine-1-phosphate N-acetyltransferase / galactosamine-1-phosphate N-acetyltransferase